MKKIVEYLFNRINYLFLFFIGITFFGAIRSPNLNIFNLPQKFSFIIIVSISVLFFIYSHSFLWFKFIFYLKKTLAIFNRNRSIVTIILFSLIIGLQIFILLNVTTAIGWDVGAIISRVNKPDSLNDYLSIYPNNQLYFFLMFFYNKVISLFIPGLNGQWIIFQILNLFFIDMSAIVLYKATEKFFNRNVACLILYFYMFLFMLSPWIMVPYTDQISLFLTVIVLYLYSNLKSISGFNYFLVIITIGILIGLSFLIKPSSIVYIIAWFIIAMLKQIKTKHFSLKNIVVIFIIFLTVSLPIKSFEIFMEKQAVIEISHDKEMPWTHFVMMGLTGSGGYNSEDVKRDIAISNSSLRKKSNIQYIKQRLKSHGFLGHTIFLLQKHFNNTDRGDFGWGRDGTPQLPMNPSKNKVQSILRDLYYQQGYKTNAIRFYMQIIWIIMLFGMLYSFKAIQEFSNTLDTLICIKLTVIGAFIYLLIFEGGRSRYLIQYLPFFLILSSTGLFTFYSECLKEKLFFNPNGLESK